jgi:alpha-galactosidase
MIRRLWGQLVHHLVVTNLVIFFSVVGLRAAVPTLAELERARVWETAHFPLSASAPNSPAFSFTYDGAPSSQFLTRWSYRVGPSRQLAESLRSSQSHRDPATGLEVTADVTAYKDFPAIEWVLSFRNSGDKVTPLLEDIRAADFRIPDGGMNWILHGARGASNQPNDFAPVEHALGSGLSLTFAPSGGLSSAGNTVPFFNLVGSGERSNVAGESQVDSTSEGWMLAVGWSGQWRASFAHEPGSIRVTAGMELTHLRLNPDEQIRSPRILLIFWEGADHARANNLLRAFLLAHDTPRPWGRVPAVPVAIMPWWQFDDGNRATEDNQIEYASLAAKKKIPVDTYWLDAGWFEGGWPDGVGNWFVRRDAFPRGLRPLADTIHGLGMRFLVWFEPECVAPGTWPAREHPDWLLGNGKDRLFNLGNAEARRWLIGYLSAMLERDGIDIYRQDMSLLPLEYWRSADAPDRRGITEIRYIEGLYDLWDELRERLPQLLIDNGASGGRRIDLETVSRALPLWRFDYFDGKPAAFQAQGVGLGLFVPLSSTGIPPTTNPLAEVPNLYAARSVMSAGAAFTWDLRRPDFDDALARRLVEEQKRIQKFFLGDLYPLTEINADENKWLAYQCDRPDLGQGIVMAFRRTNAPQETTVVRLKGLVADHSYVIRNADSGAKRAYMGRALAKQGLPLKISTAPGSALIFYTDKELK